MASLSAKIALSLAADLVSAVDVGRGEHKIVYGPNYVLTDGTGANQAKSVWADERTLAASADEDIDLAGGVNDIFGSAITFTKIKALIVVAAAGNTNDVVIGGAEATALASIFGATTDTLKVKPGGMVALVAPDANGYAVGAGTADLLKVANSGGGTGVTYTIIVVGVA